MISQDIPREQIDALRPDFEAEFLCSLKSLPAEIVKPSFARDADGEYVYTEIRGAFKGYALARLAPIDPEPPAVTIQWYESAAAVNSAMWAPALEAEGLTAADLDESGFQGLDDNGQAVDVSLEDALASMEDMGCWGFCDSATNTVHAWARADADPATVMHMLAHEIGHLTGQAHPDGYHEEMRAEQFGRAAMAAYRLMRSHPAFGSSGMAL
jgi:hypothetical protein